MRGGWVGTLHTAGRHVADVDLRVIVSRKEWADRAQWRTGTEERLIDEPLIRAEGIDVALSVVGDKADEGGWVEQFMGEPQNLTARGWCSANSTRHALRGRQRDDVGGSGP